VYSNAPNYTLLDNEITLNMLNMYFKSEIRFLQQNNCKNCTQNLTSLYLSTIGWVLVHRHIHVWDKKPFSHSHFCNKNLHNCSSHLNAFVLKLSGYKAWTVWVIQKVIEYTFTAHSQMSILCLWRNFFPFNFVTWKLAWCCKAGLPKLGVATPKGVA